MCRLGRRLVIGRRINSNFRNKDQRPQSFSLIFESSQAYKDQAGDWTGPLPTKLLVQVSYTFLAIQSTNLSRSIQKTVHD